MPPSAIRDRKRCPSLITHDTRYGRCLTMRSWSDPGGHCARVIAIGPNSSRWGPSDCHEPRARLQSMRAARMPSSPNSKVYFPRSSGRSTVSSPPWNLTSCQDVPVRPLGSFAVAHAVTRTTISEIERVLAKVWLGPEVPAAVHVDRRAGDIAAGLRAEPRHHPGDVVRRARSSQRQAFDECGRG